MPSPLPHPHTTVRSPLPAAAALAVSCLACLVACSGPAEPPLERDLGRLGPDTGARAEALSTAPEDRWTLATGQSLQLTLELPDPARLLLAGASQGDGTLTVTLEERSPETGAVLERRSLPQETRDSRLEAGIELARAEGVLFVDLAWKSTGGGALSLERVQLSEPRRERVPIILFSVDTLSARHMGLYGYERANTPNLERLASESVVFEQCLSNAPFTPPSYASQFTGLLPCSTWVDPDDFEKRKRRAAKKYETWNVPSARWTLAESLRASGYRTAAFVDNPMCGPAFGFDQGFEFYDMSAQQIPITDPDGGIRTIVPAALQWIDGLAEGEPFFLFVNVLDVHGPYGPPPEYRGRFGSEALEGPELPVCPSGHEVFGAIPDYNAYTLAKRPLPETLPYEPLIRLYDEEILFVDAEISRFVEELRKRGILDRCALVVSSDHGEMMAEGDFKFGHGVLSQENLQVPLVVRLPAARHGGTRVPETVQLLDLYPTFLELAGLRPRDYLHGRSLLPLCDGETRPAAPIWHEGGLLGSTAVTDGPWRLVEWHLGSGGVRTRYSFPRGKQILAELAPDLYTALWGDGSYQTFTTAAERNRPKLRRVDQRLNETVVRELFDVSQDPHQKVDLSSSRQDVAQRLQQLLEAGHERSRLARTLMKTEATALGAGVQAELRDLGYAGEAED